SLAWALEYPPLIIVILLATLALNVVLIGRVPKGFFPLQDTGGLQGGLQGAQDASFQSMRDSVLDVEKVIQADPAVDNVIGFTGGQRGPGGGASNTGFTFVHLKPLDQRGISASDVVDRLRPKLEKMNGA